MQYFVLADKVYDAFYKLDDPVNQIKAFVFDVVRARVPKIKLDDVFEKKDEIAGAVKAGAVAGDGRLRLRHRQDPGSQTSTPTPRSRRP